MSAFESRRNARNKSRLAEYAASNRRNGTWSEQILWAALRGRALGVTFRRQVPIVGRFIADFYCAEARLIVEVDGPVHGLKVAADRRRDRVLVRSGFTVVRLPSELVVQELDVALERVFGALLCKMPHRRLE